LIRKAVTAALRGAISCGIANVAFAADTAPAPLPAEPAPAPSPNDQPAVDTTIDRHRTAFDVLNERMIGVASRSVRFDWRRSRFGVGGVFSQLLELNNFNSLRAGASVRKPLGNFLGEIAIDRVFTWGSDTTRKIALTPFRQLARPSRYELDVNLGYPIAEGVATARPGFFPATELVLFANVGFRYLFYPSAFVGGSFRDVAKSILSPRLSGRELEKLEPKRSPGMQIEDGRYNVVTGLSLDVFFQSGGFFTPRALISPPLRSGGLGWWWEMTFSGGWMF
jgi:hypothetical protein